MSAFNDSDRAMLELSDEEKKILVKFSVEARKAAPDAVIKKLHEFGSEDFETCPEIDFKLPDEAKKKLAEIFPKPLIPAIERACIIYLMESQSEKIPLPELGRGLAEVAEKTDELRQLIEKNKTALRHAADYLPGGIRELKRIDDSLGTLSQACRRTPTYKQWVNPKRGRPPGSHSKAEVRLAFSLVFFYWAGHGHKAPKQAWNGGEAKETGPMVEAARILMPVLGLGSDLSGYFRMFQKAYEEAKEAYGN